MNRRPLLASLLLAASAPGVWSLAATAAPEAVEAPPGPAAIEFFEKQVRPLLVERCVKCHSGVQLGGNLDLSARVTMLQGGDLGPALVPGDPDRSLIIRAIRHTGSTRMPPGGKLADEKIRIIEDWVRMGAPWPGEKPGASTAPRTSAAFARRATHWSLQPVREPVVPAGPTGASPVDRFLDAEFRKAGIRPNPPADRRLLLRRATFDLTGLPPTEAETAAFLDDRSPDAFARVVDRLLASPAYGERWGRHWLDIVRYADSNGRDWDEVFPNAWRYRDWVIRSLNRDLPYDEFVRLQVAGDLMPAGTPEETYDRVIATGFLVMGPKLLAQQDRVQLLLDVIDEQIDTIGKAFLGVSLGCARCHDHKFDAVTTRDYYALAGIFKSTRTLGPTLPRNDRVMYWNERPLAPESASRAAQAHADAVRKMEAALKACKDSAEKERLSGELKALQQKAPPPVPMAMAVQEIRPANMRVHLRGSYQNLGEEAPRGFPVYIQGERLPVPREGSGRLELARWLTSSSNPLFGRVMVNRVWQGHFGQGLVRTPDNFGTQGEGPTHPALLDYLTRRFVESGWSLKKLHRLVMLTAAYQRSSDYSSAGAARDPENRRFWRVTPRRLEAEALRDAMLLAAGELDRTRGGTLLSKTSGFPVKEFPVKYEQPRRSVYLPVVRGNLYDVLKSFDFADPCLVVGRRDQTTVAPQALVMLNSPFVTDQARKLAAALLREPMADTERVESAYQRTVGRQPTSAEVNRTLDFLRDYQAAAVDAISDPQRRTEEAWRSFCQSLLASTEFQFLR